MPSPLTTRALYLGSPELTLRPGTLLRPPTAVRVWYRLARRWDRTDWRIVAAAAVAQAASAHAADTALESSSQLRFWQLLEPSASPASSGLYAC